MIRVKTRHSFCLHQAWALRQSVYCDSVAIRWPLNCPSIDAWCRNRAVATAMVDRFHLTWHVIQLPANRKWTAALVTNPPKCVLRCLRLIHECWCPCRCPMTNQIACRSKSVVALAAVPRLVDAGAASLPSLLVSTMAPVEEDSEQSANYSASPTFSDKMCIFLMIQLPVNCF